MRRWSTSCQVAACLPYLRGACLWEESDMGKELGLGDREEWKVFCVLRNFLCIGEHGKRVVQGGGVQLMAMQQKCHAWAQLLWRGRAQVKGILNNNARPTFQIQGGRVQSICDFVPRPCTLY